MSQKGAKCKLRKCQGRRGCLCVKSPIKTGPVYAGVHPGSSPAAELVTPRRHSQSPPKDKSAVVPKPSTSSPSPPAAADETPGNAPPAESTDVPTSLAVDQATPASKVNNEEAKDAPTDVETAGKKEEASTCPENSDSPATSTDVGNSAAVAQDAEAVVDTGVAAPAVPQTGAVKLRYNHYVHDVTVTSPPGEIKIADVDELFSLSYGFKGNYVIHLRGPGRDGPTLMQTDDTISGLVVGEEFWCEVDEDPEEAKKEKVTYKAASTDGFIKTSDNSSAGEDSARCSCIEGNPCAVPYNCKDWANRFDVAKANGWKGF